MEEKMDRIERQLRLYELVCSYAVTGFETIEEAFPDSSRRMVQRDLKDLKDAGLVSDERRGKFICYELSVSVLDEIVGWLAALKGEDNQCWKKLPIG